MNPNDKEEEKGEIEILDNDGSIELDEAAASSEEPSDIEPTDEVEREAEDLQQKYLRLAADFENYKKRLAKEKADVVSYGNEELIKAFLNVLDNLDRALDHTESGDDSALLEGVKLVHKQFLSYLEKFGVTNVDASAGTEFDPRVHQAIERVESEELSSGLILSQMLPGYMLKDRLLRPALVVVSKGIEQQAGNSGTPGFTNADNS